MSAPDPLHSLHPRAVTAWRIAGLARGLAATAAVLLADLLVGWPLPTGLVPAGIAVLVVAHVLIVPPFRYRAWGYTLRDNDVYLRYGVLFRTTSVLPHARIQHVDTQHGPLDRWLGLADLVVFTAGSRGAVIAVPSLARETAEELRDRLVALSGAGDAV